MKVQVSKVMAREINRNICTELTTIARISYVELSVKSYEMLIARAVDNYQDFIPGKGVMRALEIVYNDRCFACDRYLTTKQLYRLFLESEKTYDSFMATVFCDIEI